MVKHITLNRVARFQGNFNGIADEIDFTCTGGIRFVYVCIGYFKVEVNNLSNEKYPFSVETNRRTGQFGAIK